MSLPILPIEILHIIYDLCYIEEKYSLSQTCKYFRKLKKPIRYYCSWYIDNPNYNSDDDSDDDDNFMICKVASGAIDKHNSVDIDNPNYNSDDDSDDDDSDDNSDDNSKYIKKYIYFFHIENCLKYCDKIKYNSERDTGVYFIEIGKVIQLKLIRLVSFDLHYDDPYA